MNASPQVANKPGPQIAIQTQQWNGPLPPPGALEQFERVTPGSAERILRMAEQQQAHRISQESKELASRIADSKRGQLLGGIIACSALVGAVINSVLGGPWPASVALVGIPIFGAVEAFIRGRQSNSP